MYVRVEQKDIADVNVDAIVCPVPIKDEISVGLMRYIIQKGGDKVKSGVQDVLYTLRQQRVPYTIMAGALRARHIIFASVVFSRPENQANDVSLL